MSVYAKVGFGVIIDSEESLPWNDDSFERDSEVWWRKQCGWVEEWKPSFTDAESKNYFKRQQAFCDANPPPFEYESYGYGDYQTPVLLVPGTRQSNEYCDDLDLSVMQQKPDAAALLAFCKKYKIKLGRQKPRWLLFGRCW